MKNIGSIFQKRERTIMNWVAYWRKNPQRFAKEYLEISLFLYQKILIFMIERANTFMYIASRGQGGLFLG